MTVSAEGERPTLAEVVQWEKEAFVSHLGSIYEHSPWVAEALYENHKSTNICASMTTVQELFQQMKGIVDGASQEQKLTLLREHPDLCERVSTKLETLTDASREEQSRAGLAYLTEEERTAFLANNTQYRETFGFPFILAVRNASKYTVMSAVESRVHNSYETEFAAALYQVHKIAWMRLLSSIRTCHPKGFLTCHVLDTASGSPAVGMRVHLKRLSSPSSSTPTFLAEFITNDDGRLPGGPALKGENFQVGTYEWNFFVGDYFARKSHLQTTGTPFLNEVPIRFGIDDPDEHYHVPLLVSPYGFSTYRGS